MPLVIVDPRHAGARRDGRIVRDVDLAPTLYELTGTTAPRDLDGISLAPALDGKPTPDERAFAETELWLGEVPALPDELRLPYPGLAQLTEVDTRAPRRDRPAQGRRAGHDGRAAPHGARRTLEARLRPHA